MHMCDQKSTFFFFQKVNIWQAEEENRLSHHTDNNGVIIVKSS